MTFGLLKKDLSEKRKGKQIDGVFKFIVDINYNGGTYSVYCWHMLKNWHVFNNCLPHGVICHIKPNKWEKLQQIMNVRRL